MSEAALEDPLNSSIDDPIKPRMRGWIHLISAFVAAPFGVLLVQHAQPGHLSTGAALYAISLVLLLGTSGTYHTPTWSDRTRTFLRLLDHSMIFVLIGGSYSPFLLGIDLDWVSWVLPGIWIMAFLGILRTVFLPNINRFLKSAIYVLMGWIAAPLMVPFHAAYGDLVLALLLIGGLAFTGGALIYARQTPNPWPETFGYHEIFHVSVVLGSICHYVAVWLVVA